VADYRDQLKIVKKTLNIQRYYESVGGVMSWDFWNDLPIQSRPYMNDVGNFIKAEAQKHLLDDETKKAVNFFRDFDLTTLEDDYQRGAVQNLTRRYDKATKVPIELSIEISNFCRDSQMFWQDCNKKSDWQAFKPNVQKMFDLKSRVAEAINPDAPSYDVLVNEVDVGMSTDRIQKLFAQLKDGIVDILGKVQDKHADIDTSPLKVLPPMEVRRELAHKAALAVGFDFEKGTSGIMMHPMCGTTGPRDARPNTNYDFDLFGTISMMHECGHGMYGYSSNDQAVEWGLWGGLMGGFHESQSRFTENIIGKSRQFWQHLYPTFQQAVPELRQYDLDAFHKAIIKAQPSLRRVTADELTYNLHLIIRFELEKAYFDGKIKVEQLEELWNDKYEEYMGIRPPNAREGVLQDVHWSSGHVGYFQSYTLGDLYGAQLRAKLLGDIPDAYVHVANGNVAVMNDWLIKKVRQFGMTYTPNDLIVRATGEELDAKYCIAYLKEKYLG